MNSHNTPETLDQLLKLRSASTQTMTFINGQDARVSVPFGQMYERACMRLAALQAMGLQPGSQLIIQSSDNAMFIEAFWACLLGGIVAVPVAGGNSAEHRLKLFRIAEKLNNPGLFTEQQNLDRLDQFSVEHQLDTAFERLRGVTQIAQPLNHQSASTAEPSARVSDRGQPATTPQLHESQADDVAFIQFSSGSTSTPKGIVLSHSNLMINTRSIIEGCHMTEADHLLSWMPLTHDMGLIGFHLTPLVCNVSHSLMPTDLFVRRPGLWLSESARAGASILCSPNFGYQHLHKSFKADKHADLDLSSVRLLFNGAEPISVSLCKEFMQTFKPFGLAENAMYPVYGLAEASLAVTFPPLTNRFTQMTLERGSLGVGQKVQISADAGGGVTFVAVGRPVSQVQLSIRDADGADLPEAVVGHICIKGGNVTRGYYKEPELNSELIDIDGWLDTGDLGFVSDQQLYITGRAKDIVFVSGQNIYPHDLEEIILQNQLVERGKLAVSSRPAKDQREEQLLVFVQHRGSPDALADTARAITSTLGTEAGISVHAVVPVPKIPKTTSGKVQRFLLVEGLQRGDYQALVQPPASDPEASTDESDTGEAGSTTQLETANAVRSDDGSTSERLLAICNEQVEAQQVTIDDNLFELGISSLTLAQIHAAIEDAWPDRVEITDLFDYPTVAELAAFLDAKG